MRIAHVTPYVFDEPGVIQDHVRAVARLLAERGHEIVVLAPERRRAALREGRERLRALASGRAGALTGPPGQPLVLAAGPALPLRQGSGVALPVATRANVRLALERGAFDVVHVHEPGLPSTPFSTALRAPGLVVASFHAASDLALVSPLRSSGREAARERLDALVVASEQVRAAAEARFGPGDYRLVPDGVDIELFNVLEPISPPRVVVEWTSERRAESRAVLRAFEGLDADVVLLSTTGRRPVLAPAARPGGARVRPLRALTAGQRAELLAGAAVFLASPGGSLQTALEAAACGVAVATPEDAPAAELVEHERTGLRYPAVHAELAAAVTLRLLDDAPLRQRLGAAARIVAESRTYARTADELEALYTELAARRRPTQPSSNGSAAREILVDLHMHTEHSGDCATPVDDLLDRAVELGLGAIAVTDHNTIGGGLEAERRARERELDLQVIVGSEIMTDGQGEVIGLFLHEEVPRGLPFADTLARIRDQGGLVYVPHPFDRMHSIPSPETLRRHVDEIDVLETQNGRLYFEADNAEAQRFAERYNLVGGAGSDCHVPEGLATAAQRMAPFDGPEEFLSALRDAEQVRRARSLLYLQGLKWVRQLR